MPLAPSLCVKNGEGKSLSEEGRGRSLSLLIVIGVVVVVIIIFIAGVVVARGKDSEYQEKEERPSPQSLPLSVRGEEGNTPSWGVRVSSLLLLVLRNSASTRAASRSSNTSGSSNNSCGSRSSGCRSSNRGTRTTRGGHALGPFLPFEKWRGRVSFRRVKGGVSVSLNNKSRIDIFGSNDCKGKDSEYRRKEERPSPYPFPSV